MCGIAGFLHKNFVKLDKSHLVNMGNAIAHRGPDAHDEYIDDYVGLCHRRLSILDLSEAGIQPMFSPDKQVIIVFNGEIYNFPELKEELIGDGIVFNTGTDTEVIIHLYIKYGNACVAKLNGMFAFTIWDKRDNSMLIARDRLGKKPLYYLEHDGRFAFASEIKALLTLPDVPREIRYDAVRDFFTYQYVPDPKSIFKHIHKLPAAHYMIITGGNVSLHKYWELDFSSPSTQSEAYLKQELQTLANACTKRRMLSDVPLGAFLSGGVDSSGVVAMMAKQSDAPVTTCTIAFDDKKYNEAEFAKTVAEQYETAHHEFLVSQNVTDTLEHIVSFFDEPFADPSLVPTFFVSELARQAVTVAIAGDGGDEVFAGYEKYTTDDIENRLREKFPLWMRKNIFPSMAKIFAISENSLFRKAKSLLTSLSVSPEIGFYMTNAQMQDSQWESLANEHISDALGHYHPSEITTKFYDEANGPDHLSKILYTDIKTYLCGGILVKVDRMSMANSLEVRAPILDKEIMEFAAKVPSKFKFNNGEKKYLLKEAFKDYLPDDILYRKKMGFSVPLAKWFREEIKLIAEKFLIKNAKGLPTIFNMARVNDYWQQHQTNKADHSAILWSMLMFEMWWQRYMPDEQ
ncbi:asparagine synthase (glutamine-hydrolyzing) [Agaribacter marinus]|uniref:asparagine synthase (glutamine-hydrolyzing) n=1 Tax=Agaribacter marinus TaxID=1431249 RepID=A0AA37SXH9_9ALTE|nr:asparagine synthase (glutamine-hydrolyzing) [Agaribacter marinus]GLR70927.1 asparagine synthetase B [Agaribacter marinus]